MSYQAIIFDLDGVLLSTDEFHYQAWKELADQHQIPFDHTINNRLRGVSRMESLEIILEQSATTFTPEEKEAMAEQKNRRYRSLLEQLTPEDISASVRETLVQLKERGYLLAIGSSSKNAKFILEKTDLLSPFNAISDGTNISNSKPDPEVFIKAADMLKVPYQGCAVIEDAEAGLIAAKATNMYAIAINDAFHSSYADVGIPNIKELLTIFQ